MDREAIDADQLFGRVELEAAVACVKLLAVTAFDARLKFLGHAFEVVGIAKQFDLYTFSAEELEHVLAGREALCRLLETSDAVDWAAIRADRGLYESVVGGLCHAHNGLLLSVA